MFHINYVAMGEVAMGEVIMANRFEIKLVKVISMSPNPSRKSEIESQQNNIRRDVALMLFF